MSQSPRARKPRADSSRALALSEREFERARRMLMHRDPTLGALIKRVGRCRLPDSRQHEPFAGLVRVIVSQQLSAKAAATIFSRLVALAGGATALTPSALLALDPSEIRKTGVSRPKITYLCDLAARVGDGRLDLAALDLCSDDEVLEAITGVKGLGRWSAEMFLMFRLNRPDVFPTGDLGIVKGIQKLYGLRRKPTVRRMLQIAEPWRPYRSVASWYLWRMHE